MESHMTVVACIIKGGSNEMDRISIRELPS